MPSRTQLLGVTPPPNNYKFLRGFFDYMPRTHAPNDVAAKNGTDQTRQVELAKKFLRDRVLTLAVLRSDVSDRNRERRFRLKLDQA